MLLRMIAFALCMGVSTAASAVWVESFGAELVMTTPQRNIVAAWVQTQWPEAVISEVERAHCQRRLVPACVDHDADQGTPDQCNIEVRALCSAVSVHEMSAAEHLSMVASGTLIGKIRPDDIAFDGSTVTAFRRHGPTLLTEAETTALAVSLSPVFGIPPTSLHLMEFHKFTQFVDGVQDTVEYRALAHQRIEVTAEEWLVCLKSVTCGRQVD